MVASVFVLGGAQSDFARNLAREGHELVDVVGEVIDGALAAAGVAAADIGAIHVGNAFGELFAGQAQLGAMPATARPALWGVPATRHEAACASGSVALLAAMAAIEAGRCECALVLGVEQERNVSGEQAARHMGSAAWIGHEGEGARFLWPHMFARIAEAYAARWGLEPRHLAAIAAKNLTNARANPLAQTRGWSFADDAFTDRWADDVANPIIEGRLRRLDCSQVTDGAAAIVVASADFAAARAPMARILGWGHRTAGLSLDAKLARAADAPYLLPHLREAITDAYRRAGVTGPDELDGAEVHDCFSITEYLAIDHLGVTEPGQAGRALDDGTVARGGRFPINPSGGLIGGGHPVGATGVRMVLDAARQCHGAAGAYQVPGAQRFATLNIGGSGTTACAFVLGGAA
ncbi:MAG: thiolase domain-containing protein [Myxococcales bacterium]|nr:thiolase domain-containing protein [Myxococcales bacterium]